MSSLPLLYAAEAKRIYIFLLTKLFFLSNFFLLDNTLNGGDQVRGGFSSQNIPTPLKTIQKALLLFCLSLTTVVIKSVK